MSSNFLIVDKKILPEYFEKVIEARRLIETGDVREVNTAVKRVGISRSTYYKYKDYIFAPDESASGRRAVLSLMLDHEKGVLSTVLNQFSECGANILTITQSLPIHQKASVTLSLDVTAVTLPMPELLLQIERVRGVESVRLVAME